MGNSSKGSMLIACENVSVSPGEEVSGHIYFQLEKSIASEAALFLKFVGTQMIEWDGGMISNTKGKKKVKNDKKKVMTWANGLETGQYDIPFAYKLPEILASSFKIEETHYNAHIVYKMHSILLGKDRKIKNTCTIEVLNPYHEARVPLRSLRTIGIHNWCQTHRIEIKVCLNNSFYYSNEDIEFEVMYDNSGSSFNLNGITISLVRRLVLQTGNGDVKQFSKVLMQKKADTVRAGVNQQSGFKGTFSLKSMCQKIASGKSIKTDLILCKYLLIVSQRASGCCVGVLTDMETEILLIPDKVVLAQPQIESPSNWNPQSYPVARLSYTGLEPSAPALDVEYA